MFAPTNAVHACTRGSELAARLSAVADGVTPSGPRYRPGDTDWALRTIVFRNYGPPVLELCHLVRAAGLSVSRPATRPGNPPPYERVFWGLGPVRARIFADHFAQAARARGLRGLVVAADHIELTYGDGRYRIAFSRMPQLTALLEMVLELVPYPELDRLLAPVHGPLASRTILSESANAVQRAVYQALDRHLPTAQEVRKFFDLHRYLRKRHGAAGPDADLAALIEDEDILAFWCARPAADADDQRGSGDFVLYATVLRAFNEYIKAWALARTVAAEVRAAPVGPGGIDPADIDTADDPDAPDDGSAWHQAVRDATRPVLGVLPSAADPGEPPPSPLQGLADEPAVAVKFLTGTETGLARPLYDLAPLAGRLPLSWLRSAVFDPLQRKRTPAAGTDRIPADTPGYRDRLATLARLGVEARRRALVCVAQLQRRGDPVARGVVARLTAADAGGAEIAELLSDADRATPRRQGFNDPAVPADAFIEGAPLLLQLARDLESFGQSAASHARLQAPDAPDDYWRRQFETDRRRFADRFAELYDLQPREATP